jgi:hypothetical protein
MQRKSASRGAVCAGLLAILLPVGGALAGSEPVRALVISETTLQDLVALDMVNAFGFDRDARPVIRLCVSPGGMSSGVVAVVPKTLNGTDIDNDGNSDVVAGGESSGGDGALGNGSSGSGESTDDSPSVQLVYDIVFVMC